MARLRAPRDLLPDVVIAVGLSTPEFVPGNRINARTTAGGATPAIVTSPPVANAR